MRTHGVVVVGEPIELDLEFFEARSRGLLSQPLLHRLMKSLDFSAGLWMVRTGVLRHDPQALELALKAGPATSRARGIDRAIEFLSDVKSEFGLF
jgi:hypothetical protein